MATQVSSWRPTPGEPPGSGPSWCWLPAAVPAGVRVSSLWPLGSVGCPKKVVGITAWLRPNLRTETCHWCYVLRVKTNPGPGQVCAGQTGSGGRWGRGACACQGWLIFAVCSAGPPSLPEPCRPRFPGAPRPVLVGAAWGAPALASFWDLPPHSYPGCPGTWLQCGGITTRGQQSPGLGFAVA